MLSGARSPNRNIAAQSTYNARHRIELNNLRVDCARIARQLFTCVEFAPHSHETVNCRENIHITNSSWAEEKSSLNDFNCPILSFFLVIQFILPSLVPVP